MSLHGRLEGVAREGDAGEAAQGVPRSGHGDEGHQGHAGAQASEEAGPSRDLIHP